MENSPSGRKSVDMADTQKYIEELKRYSARSKSRPQSANERPGDGGKPPQPPTQPLEPPEQAHQSGDWRSLSGENKPAEQPRPFVVVDMVEDIETRQKELAAIPLPDANPQPPVEKPKPNPSMPENINPEPHPPVETSKPNPPIPENIYPKFQTSIIERNTQSQMPGKQYAPMEGRKPEAPAAMPEPNPTVGDNFYPQPEPPMNLNTQPRRMEEYTPMTGRKPKSAPPEMENTYPKSEPAPAKAEARPTARAAEMDSPLPKHKMPMAGKRPDFPVPEPKPEPKMSEHFYPQPNTPERGPRPQSQPAMPKRQPQTRSRPQHNPQPQPRQGRKPQCPKAKPEPCRETTLPLPECGKANFAYDPGRELAEVMNPMGRAAVSETPALFTAPSGRKP